MCFPYRSLPSSSSIFSSTSSSSSSSSLSSTPHLRQVLRHAFSTRSRSQKEALCGHYNSIQSQVCSTSRKTKISSVSWQDSSSALPRRFPVRVIALDCPPTLLVTWGTTNLSMPLKLNSSPLIRAKSWTGAPPLYMDTKANPPCIPLLAPSTRTSLYSSPGTREMTS